MKYHIPLQPISLHDLTLDIVSDHAALLVKPSGLDPPEYLSHLTNHFKFNKPTNRYLGTTKKNTTTANMNYLHCKVCVYQMFSTKEPRSIAGLQQIPMPMNKENRPVVTDEPVEFEK
jgi:hypothetical protein